MRRDVLDKVRYVDRYRAPAEVSDTLPPEALRGISIFEASEVEHGMEVEVQLTKGRPFVGILSCVVDLVSGRVSEIYVNGKLIAWTKLVSIKPAATAEVQLLVEDDSHE